MGSRKLAKGNFQQQTICGHMLLNDLKGKAQCRSSDRCSRSAICCVIVAPKSLGARSQYTSRALQLTMGFAFSGGATKGFRPRGVLRQARQDRQGLFRVSCTFSLCAWRACTAHTRNFAWRFSEVFKGFSKIARKPVAIKIIDLESAEDEIDDIQQEIAILSQLDSTHVTK